MMLNVAVAVAVACSSTGQVSLQYRNGEMGVDVVVAVDV